MSTIVCTVAAMLHACALANQSQAVTVGTINFMATVSTAMTSWSRGLMIELFTLYTFVHASLDRNPGLVYESARLRVLPSRAPFCA